MNVNDISGKNPDGSPNPTFGEVLKDLEAGKALPEATVKAISGMTSGYGTAMAAFKEMTKPIDLPVYKPLPRPMSKEDMAELLEKQVEKGKSMQNWTIAATIVAILALIISILTFYLTFFSRVVTIP